MWDRRNYRDTDFGLLERFTLELMQAGGSAELARKLLIDNRANALSIRP